MRAAARASPPSSSDDARASSLVASFGPAEMTFDDDEYRMASAERVLDAPGSPHWEILELAATFGAAGGGVAALALDATSLAALPAALPFVAAFARRRADRRRAKIAAAAFVAADEEIRALLRKAARDRAEKARLEGEIIRGGALIDAAEREAAAASRREEERRNVSNAVAERMRALERSVERSARARAFASSREAGTAAGDARARRRGGARTEARRRGRRCGRA